MGSGFLVTSGSRSLAAAPAETPMSAHAAIATITKKYLRIWVPP